MHISIESSSPLLRLDRQDQARQGKAAGTHYVDGKLHWLGGRSADLEDFAQVRVNLRTVQQLGSQQGFCNVLAPLPVLSQPRPQGRKIRGESDW